MTLRFRNQPFQWNAVVLGGLFSLGTFLWMLQMRLVYGMSMLSTLSKPGIILMLCTSADIFLSAFHRGARRMQPAFFFALMPFCFDIGIDSIFGLGFYAMGILMLFRLGFYEHRRNLKYFLSIAYVFFWVFWFAVNRHIPIIDAIVTVYFIMVFLFLLYYAFSEKLMVYLKEPRPRISLREKGLSDAERTYIKAIIAGRNYKQIAFDYEVKESTVRNTVARAYKKLGISDRADLVSQAVRFDIED